MRYRMCAVKDRAANAFAQPMFVPAMGVAMRSFQDEINRQDEKNALYMHPDDYDLYDMGEYDDSDGTFTMPEGDRPVIVARGKDVVRKSS